MTRKETIAIIGGTGPQGRGLAFRLACAGHTVIIGSRSAERASSAAQEITASPGVTTPVTAGTNARAAAGADTIILSVPYDGHAELIKELAPHLSGSLIISCVNPLGFDANGPYGLDTATHSAAEETAQLVEDARVTAAFHHLSAALLLDAAADLAHEDVLVAGDSRDAKQTVMRLARDVTGGRAIDAGRLRLAHQLETLTAVLISVNKRYRTRSGVALTGINDTSA